MPDAQQETTDVLVVAISTVGGPALGQAILDRRDRSPSRFHVLVPERLPNQGNTWNAGQVEKDAQKRLDLLLELIGGLDVDVDGEISRLSDAADAIDMALQERDDIDEIIVVQGSKGLKKWSDKRRVKRLDKEIDLPVTQVEPGDVDQGEYDAESSGAGLRQWAEAVDRSPETEP